MNDAAWLGGLSAGDTVAVLSSGFHDGAYLGKIERVTATQFVVGGSRFRRSDGRRCGDANSYSFAEIMPPEHPAIVSRLREAEVQRLRKDVEQAAYKCASPESLRAALDVLRADRAPRGPGAGEKA